MQYENLTEDKILNIPLNKPEMLFSGLETEVKKAYKKLSLSWHPDRRKDISPKSGEVFAHIHNLYIEALKREKAGILGKNLNVLEIHSIDGKDFRFKYLKEKSFEMGNYYIASKFVVWAFKKEYKEDVEKGLNNISNIHYADTKMKEEFSRYMPVVYTTLETKDEFIVVMKKDPAFLNLGDIFQKQNNQIDAKHVAWIMSRLYNNICFIHFNKLMHGGLNIDNIFINPQTHEVMVLGGWWYSRKENEKLTMLSRESVDVAPLSLMNSKKAELLLDMELIKKVGRQLLGDATGMTLASKKLAPPAFITWLRDSSTKNAFEEYGTWMNKVLVDSFGQRKFIVFDVSEKDLY